MKYTMFIFLLITYLIACKTPPPKQLLGKDWISVEFNRSGKYDTLRFDQNSLLLNGIYVSVQYDGNKIYESTNSDDPIAEVIELNGETLAIKLFGQGSYRKVKMGYFRTIALEEFKPSR